MLKSHIYKGAALCLGMVLSGAALQAHALTPPTGFQIQTVVSGLNKPVSVAFAPDGRIFIAQKEGVVRIIKNGTLQPTPVLALTDINTAGDRGVLGMTLDPNFAQNGYLYIAYTYENDPQNYDGKKTGRIVRFTVQGDTASLSSAVVLVGKVGGDASKPSCDNFAMTADCIPSDSYSHSMGALRFGPDGKLYAVLGDGAEFLYVDPNAYDAQHLDSLAGKMLRINADGTAPADNPFYTGNPNDNRSKVWFYGLRNAFRFNFRPGTNSLYIGEVGWKNWEEINIGKRGGNYGWPCREGYEKHAEYSCDAVNYINPIHVYDHSAGTAAVTGGSFPTNNIYPEPYRSSYFFGDAALSLIKVMRVDGNDNVISVDTFSDGAGGPVEIVTGPDGYIYYLAHYAGQLRKIVYTSGSNNPPTAQMSSNTDTGPAPLAVSFSSAGSSDPDNDPLSYLWNFGNGQTSTDSNPTHTYTTNGTFTASLTVRDGKGGENTTSKTIRVGNFGSSGVNPIHVRTTSTPIPTYIGRDVTITSTVSNTGATDPFIVDIEVYNHSNVKVAQRVFENETIPQNGSKDYSFTWLPPEVGTYRVAVGLFKTNWTGLHSWENSATQFTVENRAPTTTTPFTPAHQATTVSNATPGVGENTTITTSIKNTGQAGQALIDIEVYKDGVKVAQRFYDNQSFAANEIKDFSFVWSAGSPGTYKVSVGIFKPGWLGVYAWHSEIKTITVGSAPSGGDMVIYGDALAPGWENWSWDTQLTLAQDVKVAYQTPWAGFYLHTTPFSTAGKSSFVFSLNGGTQGGGQKLQLIMYDENGAAYATKSLDGYLPGGAVPANTWVEVTIPLGDINSVNKRISGIVIQGSNGATQTPFYIDNIKIR